MNAHEQSLSGPGPPAGPGGRGGAVAGAGRGPKVNLVDPFSQAPPRRTIYATTPSPVFLIVVAATAIGGWLCLSRAVDERVAVFVFVLSGWVMSLILHEFAHAFTAWRGGDYTIPSKGYLTLDPRLYTDWVTSIVLPLIFVVMGGIGLPGGAVWINRGFLRSRAIASGVSLAGPMVNLLIGAVCLIPVSTGLIDVRSRPVLAVALAFLGFLQIAAVVLNLLPVPGLDGFGAIEPYLPRHVLAALAPVRRWSLLIVILVIFYVKPVNDLFWNTMFTVFDTFGVPRYLVSAGYQAFRFWER